jgi:hypothetical protein
MSTTEEFWASRRHYIVSALVKSHLLPGVSEKEYEAKFHEAVDEGWPKSFACMVALDRIAETRPLPSACEVHPW